MELQLQDNIAIIDINDGKANVVGHQFLDEIAELLKQAQEQASAVILKANASVFSAGFDLKEISKGKQETGVLLKRGMQLLVDLYSHPQPLIVACEGHAVGIGAFILLAADNRIGANSDYSVALPETKIGMAFTPVLLELIHSRIPAEFHSQVALQSKQLTPQQATGMGFLDELSEQPLERAIELAKELAELPKEFYARNKLDLRFESIDYMMATKDDLSCLDIRPD